MSNQQFSPQQFSPQQRRPQQYGPQQRRPQQYGPQQYGPQQRRPCRPKRAIKRQPFLTPDSCNPKFYRRHPNMIFWGTLIVSVILTFLILYLTGQFDDLCTGGAVVGGIIGTVVIPIPVLGTTVGAILGGKYMEKVWGIGWLLCGDGIDIPFI
jgi:hypothetical protein